MKKIINPLIFLSCIFFLASCGSPEKNTDVNDQASIPQEEAEKIKTLLDSLVIKNIEKDAIDRTIKEKYPILSKYTEEFVFCQKQLFIYITRDSVLVVCGISQVHEIMVV